MRGWSPVLTSPEPQASGPIDPPSLGAVTGEPPGSRRRLDPVTRVPIHRAESADALRRGPRPATGVPGHRDGPAADPGHRRTQRGRAAVSDVCQVERRRDDLGVMHLNATLDLDVVAIEAEDQISVLLELAAPAAETSRTRPPARSRSCSTAPARWPASRSRPRRPRSIDLVGRLEPTDHFGLVVFDDEVHVAVPAGTADRQGRRPRADREHPARRDDQPLRRLPARRAGGPARRGRARRDARCSSPTATRTSASSTPTRSARSRPTPAASASPRRRSASGSATTRRCSPRSPAAAPATRTSPRRATPPRPRSRRRSTACSSRWSRPRRSPCSPTGAVEAVTLLNDLATAPVDGGFMVELGDFYAGEQRKLLLEIEVPAMAALGLAQVCELELQWVELATLDTHTVTLPVTSTSSRATRPPAACRTRSSAPSSPSRRRSAPSRPPPRRSAPATRPPPRAMYASAAEALGGYADVEMQAEADVLLRPRRARPARRRVPDREVQRGRPAPEEPAPGLINYLRALGLPQALRT